MANSVDPEQTAPIGAVCSGSMLSASILKFASYVGQLFAVDHFSRQHFQMHFFLGALRANIQKNMWFYMVPVEKNQSPGKAQFSLLSYINWQILKLCRN